MTSFETLSAGNLNKPSYEEIQNFAIHLKIRLGGEAACAADCLAKEHEQAGDLLRAQMWQAVFTSIKANDAVRCAGADMVNSLN